MFNYFFSRKIDFNLDSKTFSEKIKTDINASILDVRTSREFQKGHLPGSVNFDIHDESFRKQIANLDRTKNYYVYCKSGGRSYSAAKFMKDIGFSSVYNLEGGILDWNEELEK